MQLIIDLTPFIYPVLLIILFLVLAFLVLKTHGAISEKQENPLTKEELALTETLDLLTTIQSLNTKLYQANKELVNPSHNLDDSALLKQISQLIVLIQKHTMIQDEEISKVLTTLQSELIERNLIPSDTKQENQ